MSTQTWLAVGSVFVSGLIATASACTGGSGDLNPGTGPVLTGSTSGLSASGGAGGSTSGIVVGGTSGVGTTTSSSGTSGRSSTSSSGTTTSSSGASSSSSTSSSGSSGTSSGALPGCRSSAECNGGMQCVAPGQPVCGGAAPIQECQSDDNCSDAGVGQICKFSTPCGGSACVAKCQSEASCVTSPPGLQTCDGTGHCVAKACASSASCPTHFDCQGSNGCVRRSCASDASCDGGACVNGQCWASGGSCSPLPP